MWSSQRSLRVMIVALIAAVPVLVFIAAGSGVNATGPSEGAYDAGKGNTSPGKECDGMSVEADCPDAPVSSGPAGDGGGGGGDEPVWDRGATPPLADGSPMRPPGMKPVPAPIESVNIRATKSYPPQYAALVRFGLPSGCARPGGYQVTQSGNEIRIAVSIFQPSDPNVMCTMIYGTASYAVPLLDLASGQTYALIVNDTTTTFTAQ